MEYYLINKMELFLLFHDTTRMNDKMSTEWEKPNGSVY